MISSGGQAPHVRCAPMWSLSTCGEPDGIGLAAMGVKLNGSGRLPIPHLRADALDRLLNKKSSIFRVGIFLDFVRYITLAPHGAYVTKKGGRILLDFVRLATTYDAPPWDVRCTSMGRTCGEPSEIDFNCRGALK